MATGKGDTNPKHCISITKAYCASSGSMQEFAKMGHAASDEEATISNQSAAQHQPCWGVEAVRGRRPRMEDAYCHGTINISCHEGREQQVAIAGCFDGHGGDYVAKYMARNIPNRICSRLAGSRVTATSVAAALSAAFTCLDQELQASKQACLKGSTALVALVTNSSVHISSCGDSRAIICHSGEAIQPVQDHTPVREDEQARIYKAGGQVLYHNGPRVMGALAMSRAIGDHALRPYGVIADPDTAHYARRPGDDFLVLASDGLWAAVSNEDAVKLVSHAVTELRCAGLSRQQATAVLPKLLTKVALARGSSDNITVLVMDLQTGGSSTSPCCSSSGGTACTVEAAAAAITRDQDSAPARPVVPAEVYAGNKCSMTDSDVTVTAAAVECMRSIIKAAATDSWSSGVAAAQAGSAAKPPCSEDKQQQQQQQPAMKSISSRQDHTLAAADFTSCARASTRLMQQHVVQTSSPSVGKQQLPNAAAVSRAMSPSVSRSAFEIPTSSKSAVPSPIHGDSPFAAFSAQLSRQLPTRTAPTSADHPTTTSNIAKAAEDMDSVFLSPFLNGRQTVLTEVWQDWAGMQQSNSGSSSGSGDDNSGSSGGTGRRCGTCCGSVASCSCSWSNASMSNARKRRMVTTECPRLGGPAGCTAGLGPLAGHANSAPAKLHCVGSHSPSRARSPVPHAQIVLPMMQQFWQVATATQTGAQVAMSALA